MQGNQKKSLRFCTGDNVLSTPAVPSQEPALKGQVWDERSLNRKQQLEAEKQMGKPERGKAKKWTKTWGRRGTEQ